MCVGMYVWVCMCVSIILSILSATQVSSQVIVCVCVCVTAQRQHKLTAKNISTRITRQIGGQTGNRRTDGSRADRRVTDGQTGGRPEDRLTCRSPVWCSSSSRGCELQRLLPSGRVGVPFKHRRLTPAVAAGKFLIFSLGFFFVGSSSGLRGSFENKDYLLRFPLISNFILYICIKLTPLSGIKTR